MKWNSVARCLNGTPSPTHTPATWSSTCPAWSSIADTWILHPCSGNVTFVGAQAVQVSRWDSRQSSGTPAGRNAELWSW